MKAIMLCAGEGTRCYPFTHLSPKSTQQICGIPILEYMISWFTGAPEIDKLYIVVKDDSVFTTLDNYLSKRPSYSEEILNLFSRLGYEQENKNPDLDIEVVRADGFGTGADLRKALRIIQARDELGSDFLACNGDYVTIRKMPNGRLTTQLNISDMIKCHLEARETLNTVVTDALYCVDRSDASRFGVADVENINGINVIRGFREKPSVEDIAENPWINAGVYVMNTDYVLSNIDKILPDKPNTNLEWTLLESLARSKETQLAAYLLDLYAWYDVGTLTQLVETSINLASHKGGYLKV